jgi:hypothetical protein
MPTKRRRIPPRRVNQAAPAWAARLMAGELPERDGDEWSEYVDWLYFGAEIPGLPDPMSYEGRQLWGRHAY